MCNVSLGCRCSLWLRPCSSAHRHCAPDVWEVPEIISMTRCTSLNIKSRSINAQQVICNIRENHNDPVISYEQRLGDSGEEEILFSRKRPLNEELLGAPWACCRMTHRLSLKVHTPDFPGVLFILMHYLFAIIDVSADLSMTGEEVFIPLTESWCLTCCSGWLHLCLLCRGPSVESAEVK